jgi:hypothetical protein
MFVFDVESVQQPQHPIVGPFRSERLHGVDNCSHMVRNSSDFRLSNLLSVFDSIVEDGEFKVAIRWRRGAGSDLNQLTYRTVERRPQLMHDLTRNDSKARTRLTNMQLNDVKIGLGAVIVNRRVWTLVEVPTYSLFEISKVYPSSAYLQP